MKKIFLVLFMVLMITSIWAYQGTKGVGLLLDVNTTYVDSTEENTIEINPEIFYTFMLYDKLEISPHLAVLYYNESDFSGTTDGWLYLGAGCLVNWHFIKTNVITLATGVDFNFWFSTWNESLTVYADSTYEEFGFIIPLILDINLTKNLVIRVRQDIVDFNSNETGLTNNDVESNKSFKTFNGLNPQFGFIISF